MIERLKRPFRFARQIARSMIGLPSYEAYLQHMAGHHPDREPMDYRSFFRERQQARYGGKAGGRCC